MSKILALDTSSDLCSVSLHLDGKFHSKSEVAPRKHAQLILPMINDLVAEQGIKLQDLDAIAFGQGPGSFTGLRIAAGVTQGLAYGLDCSVLPISNLKAMALQTHLKTGNTRILVAIDARMDEVYWAEYCIEESTEQRSVVSLSDESVTKPELLMLSDHSQALYGAGSGFEFEDRFPEALRNQLSDYDIEARPHAEAICRLALEAYHANTGISAELAAPVYVRDEITWKKLPGRE